MRILALEPYSGGSHQEFLNGWSAQSRHQWSIETLPAFKWKWRMRHAAVTFARRVAMRVNSGEVWDAIFCSDMLDLAAFIGLAPAPVRRLPAVAYFHENQLTYPVRHPNEFDYHYAFTNMTTALAATRVWFNSAFNRDSFLAELPVFLKRMPDCRPLDAVEVIREKSSVHPPGIEGFPPRWQRKPGPMRIVWAARWEHDKNPDDFFEALTIVKAHGIDFRISVIGEQYRERPPVFDTAKHLFAKNIDRWGYLPERRDYAGALTEADIFVSTAGHEFFGISAVEAIAAGCYPLLPKRLAYPEILPPDEAGQFFYDGTPKDLARRLETLASRLHRDELWQGDPAFGVRLVERFSWKSHAPRLDDAIGDVL